MKKIICHNVKGEEFEVDSNKLRFRPSVYGLLIKDNKVLLVPQWDGYDFPGGGIESHESIEEALLRECWEETGVEVQMGEILDARSSFYAPRSKGIEGESQYWNCQLLYFLISQTGGELTTNNLEEREKEYTKLAVWMDFDNLPKYKFYNILGTKGSIELADKARRLLNK
jgi:8-oxo-dGTP pyrophosphatase MutT (NUDIX family)